MTGSYLVHKGLKGWAALFLVFAIACYNLHHLLSATILSDNNVSTLYATLNFPVLLRVTVSVLCTGLLLRLMHSSIISQRYANPLRTTLKEDVDGKTVTTSLTAADAWREKHVFITGGSEGMGLTIAKLLVEEKKVRAVTLFSRSQKKLDEAKSELEDIISKMSSSGKTKRTVVATSAGDVTSLEALQSAMTVLFTSSLYSDIGRV